MYHLIIIRLNYLLSFICTIKLIINSLYEMQYYIFIEKY